jgi:aminopeptidase YwaD
MLYLSQNEGRFDEIKLNSNIDGAGYHQGHSAFSFFNLKEDKKTQILNVMNNYPGMVEGIEWMQGDHSVFIQQGVPAIAVTSLWLLENLEKQDITHTPKDNPEIVDCSKVAAISKVIFQLIHDGIIIKRD